MGEWESERVRERVRERESGWVGESCMYVLSMQDVASHAPCKHGQGPHQGLDVRYYQYLQLRETLQVLQRCLEPSHIHQLEILEPVKTG